MPCVVSVACASLVGARLSAADPAVYSDGFEGTSINAFWTPFTQNTAMSLQPTTVHGGLQAMKFNTTTSGQKECQLTHVFEQNQFGRVTAWVYDGKNHIYFSVSAYNTNTVVANVGVQDWDYSAYYSVAGKTTYARTTGWHKFTLEAGETNLQTLIDDQVVYAAAGGARFNKVVLSMSGPGVGTVYFDDFLFESWLKPEIDVAQPGGSPIAAGGSWNAGMCFVGTPTMATFTINNTGEGELSGLTATVDGPQASEFSVTTAPASTVPAGGSTTCCVTINPATGGGATNTAALHLANNDADEDPYDIQLSASALSPSDDSDTDGMNDVAEFTMAMQGFDWQVPQPTLVSNLLSNAHHCGLYTEGDIRNAHVGAPLIGVANGTVTLQFQLQKSDDLKTWVPLGDPVQWNEPASGKSFYRLFFDGQ